MSDMRSENGVPALVPNRRGVAPPCGPLVAIDGSGRIADDECACGCTAYDERCRRWLEGERGTSHPCCS